MSSVFSKVLFAFFLVGVVWYVMMGVVFKDDASSNLSPTASSSEENIDNELLKTDISLPTTTTIKTESTTTKPTLIEDSSIVKTPTPVWEGKLIPISIGNISLQASVADTPETRQQGLSGTPFLPEGIVKLFVFDSNGMWGFWMKDMNYPIDIIWLNENREVIYIAPAVSPDTYPASFTPPTPARYVIETTSGFAASYEIKTGTVVSF